MDLPVNGAIEAATYPHRPFEVETALGIRKRRLSARSRQCCVCRLPSSQASTPHDDANLVQQFVGKQHQQERYGK